MIKSLLILVFSHPVGGSIVSLPGSFRESEDDVSFHEIGRHKHGKHHHNHRVTHQKQHKIRHEKRVNYEEAEYEGEDYKDTKHSNAEYGHAATKMHDEAPWMILSICGFVAWVVLIVYVILKMPKPHAERPCRP